MRAIADTHAPSWEPGAPPPRWLVRAVGGRLWIRGADEPPVGYLELLQALALAEGILAVDEEHRPHRVVLGANARSWRSLSFRAQTGRLRERWIRLPNWVEG